MRRGACRWLALVLCAACGPTSDSTERVSDGSSPSTVDEASPWRAAPRLPRPVANNAVVGLEGERGSTFFSFLGIDASKEWSGVVSWAFQWSVGDSEWTEIPPVPGPGRLASTAQAWQGRLYVFGGYTVAADGSEASLPNVDVYDPETRQWSVAAPIPVPVDDAVSGIWRDSLIVLVSGWHDRDNVADVQLYDPARDVWMGATSIPGPPVFGHGGGVAEDAILYRDGARVTDGSPRFVAERSAWHGSVDPADPGGIAWSEVRAPGPPLYRPAGGSIGPWVVLVGGTDNPYNYDGIGYDGRPARPSAEVWGYHVGTRSWAVGPPLPQPSMDHRTLARAGGLVLLAGGMVGDQQVSDQVWIADESMVLRWLEAAPPVPGDTGR